MLSATAPALLAAVAVIREISGFQQPVDGVERRIVQAADRQRGLIATKQLLELGLSHDAVDHRVAVGRLSRVHRGVFAVGRASLDYRARWKAATLACGPGALLSHLCAAGLWRIRPAPWGDAHVVLVGNGWHGHDGIVAHRMRRIDPADCAVVDGIPVTSLHLTCLHIGAMLGQRSLERAVVKAARRPEFHLDEAVALCERSRGRPGRRAFRQVIERDLTAELRSLSELELRFVELCRHHQIPLPKVNHDIESLMVDAVWDAQRVIVELDGYEFHKLPRDLRNDNARNRRLVLAGYRVIRFVWRDLVDDPGGVADAVRALLGGQGER